MAEWKVFGSRDGHKVRLAAKGAVFIDHDVFEEFGVAPDATAFAMEALTNGTPRMFALRPCTTGMRIMFRKSRRKGGEPIWRGNVGEIEEEIGLTEWRGKVLDTFWSFQDGMLVIRVPKLVDAESADDD